jgi:toxin ParE1/3/4
LLDIWGEGARRFSTEIADTHLRDIHAAANRLIEHPFLSRQRDELRPGVRSIVVYPTVLFCRVAVDAVEVVRVLDGRRDLPTVFSTES